MSAAEKVKMKENQATENLMTSLEKSLETPTERKKRMISLYIVHLSMLVVSLGSSIIFTGVYPYLLSLDPNVDLLEYGLVVSADAAAQMICAPLFGLIIDRIKTVRPIALLCCALFCGGNIFYALIGAFDQNHLFGKEYPNFKVRVWMMLISRFVVGAGTGLNSAGRYYVASATLISERTTHIAFLSLFQTLGFIMGPGIQAALTPLKEHELGPEGEIFFDMYTSTGWVSAATGILCFVLYLPFIFSENYISAREMEAVKKMVVKGEVKETGKELVRKMSRINIQEGDKDKVKTTDAKKFIRKFSTMSMVDGGNMTIMDPKLDTESESSSTEKNSAETTRPPLIPILTLIYNYFSFLCNFVLLETIMTTLAMDQWGWQPQQAIQNMGFIIMGAGAISVVVFGLIGPLSKRFDERKLLLTCGILPMILGRIIMFPIPGQPHPPIRQNINCLGNQVWNPSIGACQTPINNDTSTEFFLPFYLSPSVLASVSGDQPTGCSYEWCTKIPRIEIPQFMVGFVVATAGYPFCLTLSGSIYSKVLGASNPGFWLGLFATSGSVARVVGPLLVTEIYEQWGTYVMFGTVTATLVISMFLTMFAYTTLVPAHSKHHEKTGADGNKTEDKNNIGASASAIPEVIVNNGDKQTSLETKRDKEKEETEIGRRLPVYSEEDEDGSD